MFEISCIFQQCAILLPHIRQPDPFIQGDKAVLMVEPAVFFQIPDLPGLADPVEYAYVIILLALAQIQLFGQLVITFQRGSHAAFYRRGIVGYHI